MTAAAIVGGVGAIGSLIGSNQQSKATGRASRAQVGAAERGQDLLQQRFGETKELLTPFIEGSRPAFLEQQALSGALGAEAEAEAINRLTSGQQFNFLQDQGTGDINRRASAGGNLGSGTRLKALSQFRSNLLSNQISNRFNRLGAVTGVGTNAAGNLASFGASNAANQANLIGQAGEARAAGSIGRGQAFASGLQGFAQGLGTALGGFNPSTNVKGI